jgi:ABC-type hemin transport system ATPase subunit
VIDHHLIDHHLIADLAAVAAMIAQELRAAFQMVVESVIHAGLGQLPWNAIRREYAQESLNLIFLNTLLAKS